MTLVPPAIDIDADTALFIASGLRALAEVDGGHPAEIELIRQFAGDAEVDPARFHLGDGHPLTTPELRDVFLRSALLLALADGRVSEKERDTLIRWGSALGVDPVALAYLDREVRRSLLEGFAGVKVFREQAVEIGRGLGLDDDEIEDVLGGE